MKTFLYIKESREIIEVIDNVKEIGSNYIIGENKEVKGIDTSQAEFVTVNDDFPKFKRKEILPNNIEDFSNRFVKVNQEEELKNIKSDFANMLLYMSSIDKSQ